MNAAFTVSRHSWSKVAEEVGRRLGRRYSGSYCSEVASGFRSNRILAPLLQELGVMEVRPEDDATKTPVPSPSSFRQIAPPSRPTEIFIPEEAYPYCDSSGIIDWKAVHALVCQRLALAADAVRPFELYEIMRLGRREERGILPILLELKLDRVVSRVMVRGSGRTEESRRNAIKLAQERGIDLDRVIGSGPGGLVLQRDVMAYIRGYANQQTVWEVDAHLLRQRRILAQHVRDLLRANRSLCGVLAATQDRLAATSLRLGNETISRLAAEARLETERETSARLDSVVRRLAARPPIKRRTTHVEIAGIVFRDRTVTKGARS